MPEKTTSIYALIDPTTNKIRYVGKANNPQARFRKHIKDGRDNKKNDHRTNWLAKVLRSGKKPILEILEICPHNEWKRRERYWIDKLRKDGCDLTNSKDGGDGLNPSPDARKRMSLARKGKKPHNKGKRTPEHIREKQRKAAKNRWRNMPKDEKEWLISNNLTGHGLPAGWKHTDEAKRKISKSLKGNSRTKGYRHSEETTRKLSAARMGHSVSTETRKKIGRANGALNERQVKEIRQRITNGEKQRDIARLFGVRENTISAIKHGRAYKSYD